jgi:putative ABC transport system permease protein
LTRVELSYALALAVAAGALVLALGLAERRRTFAIVTALGAKRRHMRALIGSEAGVLTTLGLAAGALIGATLSTMLVKVRTGVFDGDSHPVAVPVGRSRGHRERAGNGQRRRGDGGMSNRSQHAA